MISKALLVTFVFLAGFDAGLPMGTPEGMAIITPTDLQLIGSITLKELVLLLHVFLNPRYVIAMFARPRPQLFVLSCYLFCALGIVSSLINLYPEDIPQALRFILAAYFGVVLTDYIHRRGAGTPIVALTLGVVLSGAINLYYSFTMPRGQLGFLPLLWGQNGVGGYAGFFVCLSYPLFRYLENRRAKWLLIGATIMCGFMTVLSFSKLGLIMAFFGVIAWSWQWLVTRRRRLVLRLGFAAVVLAAGAVALPGEVREQAATLYRYKFDDAFDSTDWMRAFYYVASAEVAVSRPLGASFTGIGHAFNDTWAGRTGRLPPSRNVKNVNPHNSFLAFLAADGFLGLVPCILMFSVWVGASRRALMRRNRVQYVTWGLVVATCLVFSNTLPGFFEVFFLHTIVLVMHAGARFTQPQSINVDAM